MNINPEWTTQGLFETIQNKVLRKFKLVRFEIVEAGNPVGDNNAEESPAIVLNNNATLYSIYGENIKNMSFYIRALDTPTPVENLQSEVINNNNTNNENNNNNFHI